MSRWRLLGFAVLIGMLEFGCAAERNPHAAPTSAQVPVTPVDTAPPPILYPPHDPEATYPVIRTWAAGSHVPTLRVPETSTASRGHRNRRRVWQTGPEPAAVVALRALRRLQACRR